MTEVSRALRRRLVAMDRNVMAALRSEARFALRQRQLAEWPGVASELSRLADEIARSMAPEMPFDAALGVFVADELRQLVREIHLNMHLRVTPQWPN